MQRCTLFICLSYHSYPLNLFLMDNVTLNLGNDRTKLAMCRFILWYWVLCVWKTSFATVTDVSYTYQPVYQD